MYGASFQKTSSNDKLSVVLRKRHKNKRYQTYPTRPYVCSTYVSIKSTCPEECRFRNAGCYPQVGNSAQYVQQLDDSAVGMDGYDIALAEADLINRAWPRGIPQDGARGGRDLRLHVAGDTACTKSAYALGWAAERWRARGGGAVWTTTHRWREIAPYAFGPAISVLASVETPGEVLQAIDLGYMPAITMVEFRDKRAFSLPEAPAVKVVPCPSQTRGIKCIHCRLCFKKLPKGRVIGFQLHGNGARMAASRLPILGQVAMPWGV